MASSSFDTNVAPNKRKSVGKITYSIDDASVLGRGCNGTKVYKGHFGERECAVKRINCEFVDIDAAYKEVQFLLKCDNHENVVRYYGTEQLEEDFLIALELCGSSLYEVIVSKTLLIPSQISAREVLLQTTKGLEHLHKHEIIHRDLKPENILLAVDPVSNDVKVKLSDFGISRKIPEGRTSITITSTSGTNGWMSPEIWTAMSDSGGVVPKLTKAVDIFALGCIYYYVLSGGEHPFGEDKLRRQGNIQDGKDSLDPQKLTFEHECHIQLMRTMIDTDPKRRPPVHELLSHHIFWTKNTILNFLVALSNAIEKETPDNLPHIKAVNTKYENDFKQLGADGWISKTCPEVRNHLTSGKHARYKGESAISLLRAIRNLQNHYSNAPANVKAALGSLPNNFMRYWIQRFPYLIDDLWSNFQSLKDNTPLKIYYKGKYDFKDIPLSSLADIALSASTEKIAKPDQLSLEENIPGTLIMRGTFGNRKVAVKTLNAPDMIIEAKTQEVNRLLQLEKHANLVEYMDKQVSPNGIAITMELCSYSLEDWIKSSERCPDTSVLSHLSVLKQVTAGMTHLHKNGIVHGNLKPENVLVLIDSQGDNDSAQVKITDFGISINPRKNDSWTAPELRNKAGTESCTIFSDVFSMGLLFYYVITQGINPFENGNLRKDFLKTWRSSMRNIQAMFQVGSFWAVESMLSKDPNLRPLPSSLLDHHIFWAKMKMLRFLQDVAKLTKDYPNETRFCRELLESRFKSAVGISFHDRPDGWISLTGEKVRKVLQQGGHNGKSVISLVQAIALYADNSGNNIPERVQQIFGTPGQGYLEYWLSNSRFHFLLPNVWIAFQALKTNPNLDMAKYYCDTFDFSASLTS